MKLRRYSEMLIAEGRRRKTKIVSLRFLPLGGFVDQFLDRHLTQSATGSTKGNG
jgi:hypothetical protein